MYLHLKTIVLFLCFVALANTKPSDNAGELKKVDDRALWQFSYQIANIFGFDMSLDLLDYGCYCGVGGFGTPVDDLDRCCMVHDKCYDRHNSWWCWPKVVWYSYDFSGNSITCNDETGSCSKNICMCDKAFLECVHGKEYHPKNHDIDTSTC